MLSELTYYARKLESVYFVFRVVICISVNYKIPKCTYLFIDELQKNVFHFQKRKTPWESGVHCLQCKQREK